MFTRVILFCSLAFFSFATLKPPLHRIKEAELLQPCEPRAVLASALPCNGQWDTFVSVSLLLWQGKLWGLEFATKSFVPNDLAGSDQIFDEKLFVPDFAWKPGLKLLVGSHLPFDGWDLRAGWIYYREQCTSLKKHFGSVIAPAGIGIIPLWQYPFLQIVGDNTGNPLRYASASGNWKMLFNSIDLELGRAFFPEQSLPIRLQIGAKIASIWQNYHANYENGTTVLAIAPLGTAPSLFQYISSRFEVKTREWGMGPRVGIESFWNMLWGFNLIGHGAFSVLCSFFDLKSQYSDVIQPIPNACSMVMKEHFRELTPVCEAMLGLDWGICFCSKYYFGMTLGYEWQYWWSVNHARRHYVQTLPGETFDMRGELQMQGLNFAMKFDF